MRPFLIVVAVALVSVVALVNHPSSAPVSSRADYVIIAGAPGLRWDDLSPTATPALWQLAERGSVGALAVRSASDLTCPSDGWLTLGAGNLAQWRAGSVRDTCPEIAAHIDRPDPIGARVREQGDVVEHNRRLPWGAQPGALAESVRCTAAIGPGAAVAAARPVGRVDRYAADLPADPAPLLSECVLSIVDLGTVAGTGAQRAEAVARADAAAAKVLAARPPLSVVLVAGLADTERPSRLHVAIADGPGYTGGLLVSPSTGRAGYLQLIDVAPTALTVLAKPRPARLFTGAPARRVDGRPADVAGTVRQLSDADDEAAALRDVAARFFVALIVIEVVLLAAAVPLLLRARARRGPPRPLSVSWLLRRAAEVALAAAGLALPAALAADLVPWWRTGSPGLLFALVWLAALAAATAIVLIPPLRRRTLGTLAAAAVLAAAVVVFDLFSGGSLQLNGVGGYSAIDGGRYAGIGTVGLGVFVAGMMLAAGVAAQRVARPWRGVTMAVLGSVGVVLVGSPYFGSDAAGSIALTAGVCVAVVMATGGWLTITRMVAAAVAGLVVTAAFAALDMSRPASERGSLGQFLTAAQDGTAGLEVQRASSANVISTLSSPLTILAGVSALFIFFVLLQHWGGLRRLFGIYPALRAGIAGLSVAALLGGVLNGAGLTVAGAAAAIALPLVTLAALRALAHADERTVADPQDHLDQPRSLPGPPRPDGPPRPAGPPGAVADPPGAAEDPPGRSDDAVEDALRPRDDTPGRSDDTEPHSTSSAPGVLT